MADGGLYGTGPGGPNPNAAPSQYNPNGGQNVAQAQGGSGQSPFDAARQAYTAYNAPTIAQYDQANSGAYRNMGFGNDMLGINQQDLQNQYQSNLGDLNTQIDTNGMQRQRSLADAAAYGQMMGYNTDVFNAQGAGLGNTWHQQLNQLTGTATANGAFNATGTNDQRKGLYADFQDQYGALQGNYNQQQTMLQMRQGNSQTQADILGREAQNLGMKSDQLQSTLQNGLAKLGLQNQISTGNLLDGIQNNNLQALQLYYQIVQQAGQYATASGQR